MSRHSKLTNVAAAMVAVAISAACTAAPALADPEVCTVEGPNNRVVCKPLTPNTTAPATSSGGSGSAGLTGWIDQHIVLLVMVGLAIFAIGVWRSMARENAEAKRTADTAALARGRRIADAAYEEKVADARAAAPTLAPAEYDPLGMGLRPPTSAFAMPPRPVETPADLKRYAVFGWPVPWTPGTAFGNLVGRDGDISRVHAAWAEACQLAGLGETDAETGKFTPAAVVVNVNGFATERGVDGPIENGNVSVSVDPRDYTIGDTQLNRALHHFVRTARVQTATPFERDAATDHFITVLSMDAAKSAPAQAAQTQIPVDDDKRWEW